MHRRGEWLCRRTQWRWVACMTALRTAVTRVIPLCGSAGWWAAPLCLLPAAALYALGCRGLKRRGKACLHGHPVACAAALVCLLVDGAASITALVTLFTEGAGTPGTPFTLALVAAGMLLFAQRREGLARGMHLVRWVCLAALALVLAGHGTRGRVDHLFPLLGGGMADVRSALLAGAGMGWPLLLALMEPPADRHRPGESLPPVLLCAAAALCLCLCIPHEVLITRQTLGDTLVQTVAHLSPFARLAGICLWITGLFLSAGSACSLGAAHLTAPWGRELPWLSGVLGLGLAVVQLVDTRTLWQALRLAEPWLLAALAVGTVLCWRKK